jgi:hypothetical protein
MAFAQSTYTGPVDVENTLGIILMGSFTMMLAALESSMIRMSVLM